MLDVTSHVSEQMSWHRVLGPALAAAAHAMQLWTQGRVTMTVDEVRELPLDEIHSSLANVDQEATIVALGVDGDVGGQFLLTVDDAGATTLASMFLNRPSQPSSVWREIECSVLMETGNILGSAYLSALSQLTGVRLFPTPPTMLRDFVHCVLQQAVMSQLAQADQVVLARTCFQQQGIRADWNMLFVPAPELLDLLIQTTAATQE